MRSLDCSAGSAKSGAKETSIRTGYSDALHLVGDPQASSLPAPRRIPAGRPRRPAAGVISLGIVLTRPSLDVTEGVPLRFERVAFAAPPGPGRRDQRRGVAVGLPSRLAQVHVTLEVGSRRRRHPSPASTPSQPLGRAARARRCPATRERRAARRACRDRPHRAYRRGAPHRRRDEAVGQIGRVAGAVAQSPARRDVGVGRPGRDRAERDPPLAERWFDGHGAHLEAISLKPLP